MTTDIDSTDYHDFVFKDGRLVGEFEQMYRKASGVPWHQDEQLSWVDVRLTLELLRTVARVERIVDYGAGLGYYLDILVRGLGVRQGQGIDVSETAVHRARGLFPDYDFVRADLTDANDPILSRGPARDGAAALHVIRGTLWYVYPKLGIVVQNLTSRLGSSDRLVVVQNFPPLQASFIGKDVIPNPEALVSHFSVPSVHLEDSLWYEKRADNSNDSWFIGVFKKHD